MSQRPGKENPTQEHHWEKNKEALDFFASWQKFGMFSFVLFKGCLIHLRIWPPWQRQRARWRWKPSSWSTGKILYRENIIRGKYFTGKILYGENIIRGNYYTGKTLYRESIIWENCQKFKLKRGWLGHSQLGNLDFVAILIREVQECLQPASFYLHIN